LKQAKAGQLCEGVLVISIHAIRQCDTKLIGLLEFFFISQINWMVRHLVGDIVGALTRKCDREINQAVALTPSDVRDICFSSNHIPSLSDGIGFILGKPYKMQDDVGTFFCPRRDAMQQFRDGWESEVKEVINQFHDSLFLDVGAHIGKHSVFGAKMGNRVISVEPDRRIFPYLRRNLEINGFPDSECFNYAAWNRDEWLTFYGGDDIVRGNLTEHGKVVARVFARPLDVMLRGRIPDLIKIDVEFSELEALQGLELTLGHGRPMVIFEGVDKEVLKRCSRFLSSFGYRIKQISDINYLATKDD
jgi:FkbM family methyltransferase